MNMPRNHPGCLIRFFAVALILMAVILPEAQANYTFLGNVDSTAHTPSGLTIYCEDGNQVQFTFLQTNMFRYTLLRKDCTEPLLEEPLAFMKWESVPLEYTEDGTRIQLKSSELELSIQKSPCRLIVRNKRGDVISEDDPGMGVGWDGKEVRCWRTIAPDEKFFGLGEKTGSVDKRGREWVMWNEDFPAYDDRKDPLYESIPFFIGLHGGNAYGIFLNNSYRTTFNMGAGNQRYSSFTAEQGNLDYFFLYGPEISRVVETYTQITGQAPMPPMWSLGYQQCRWSYYPASEVLRIAKTFREKQIPADVIYLDIHYMDGYRVFTFDSERFPKPRALMNELDGMGFKVVTIIDPGVKVDTICRVAREGLRDNHFVRYPDGELYVGEVWPGPSYFPDFSRQQTRDWWAGHLNEFLDIGVDGFWNDMNEPSVWGQAFPQEVIFYDGGKLSSQKKMHNLYGFLMCRAASDGLNHLHPNERQFLLTRAGFAGIQRYSAVWTGDNEATEDHLELGIRMMLGMGLSGIPFVGTDVGGFMGTPTPELFARWMQVGALSPLFRNHTAYNTRDQEPWAFGEDVERISREAIEMRYRFLPYFYSLFYEASQTGAPLWRPLFWYDANDEQVYNWDYQQQFFVGEKVLAAPVTREGQYVKKVYLPEGQWLDVNTEKVYEGKQTVYVDAPLDRLPLFLREGAIIPSREPEQFVDKKPLTKLILDIFPSTHSDTFQYYEDDGKSLDYQRGIYRLTEFSCAKRNSELHFEKLRVYDRYNAAERTLEIRFHAVSKKPREVMFDRQRLRDFRYDEQKRILVVSISDKGNTQSVTIR
jgi:alpha-glucosidase